LVNKIGYVLLETQAADKAVECFKLNASNYPASPYVYSHLADAYLAKGEKEMAIQNYRKALTLDSTLDSAKKALAKLK
jgi:predicted Zn-dependent protease